MNKQKNSPKIKIKNLENNEHTEQSNIDIILKKWSKLQKAIKEGVILKKVIIEQQKIDFAKLKTNYIEYYDLKLKIRKTYEDIEMLKNKNIINKEIIFEKNVNYNDKLKSISELLFILRNNYDYVIILSELIESNNGYNDYIIHSIIELFCNQFYDNILIPNPEQEELLILIYNLIEHDISKMNSPSNNKFLNKNTFLFNFMKYLMRKSEIKTFLSKLLGPLILEIEKNCGDIDLSFYEFENEENNKEEKEIFMDYINKLTNKNNKDKKQNKDNFDNRENNEKNNNDNEKRYFNLFLKNRIVDQNDIIFNKLYNDNISILNILDNVNENSHKNLIKLKNNFLFIKGKINFLLQSLLEKISSVPYIIKCICKIIFLTASHKFSSADKYIWYSFIGKLIFENCIFLSLNFEDNNLIENRIYNSNTKSYLKIISDLLLKAINYNFFKEEKTPIQILFNYYFLEIIPVLDEIYNKLIEVRLPNFLNLLIEKKRNNYDLKNSYKYKYFKENKDEFIYLQSICISADDILFILELISKNKNEFKNLANYQVFDQVINDINKGYEKDIINMMINPKKNVFFILFNEKYKSKMRKVLKYYYKTRRSSSVFKIPKKEEKIKYKRMKVCIKKVLKSLSDINSKSHTFLNYATTNQKFLTGIKYTLEDTENFHILNSKRNNNENNNHIIPLKWYGQYISNNKDSLDLTYKENDFEKLYKDILKEELENLKKLQLYSEIIIARDGMNLICSDKIIEKTKIDLIKCEIAKKFIKIEKFIDTEKIEVCIRIKNDELKKEIKSKKKKIKKPKKCLDIFLSDNPPDIMLSEDLTFCNHKKMEEIECLILKNRNVIPSHSHDIKEFIQKFSEIPWGIDVLNTDKKPKDIVLNEIIKGTRNSKIFITINYYMDIVKKRIKKESDDIIQIIQNFIYRQIHKYIFPKLSLQQDEEFYNKTLLLDWITPENLEIQNFYVDQLTDAELCIKKFDNAESIFDKLNYIKDAFTNINNNIKYSSGKNEEAGQDEILPIFQYILIRSCPKRMKSNINYINCFLSEDDYNSQYGYFVSQIESSFNFIMNIGYKELKIAERDYEQNIEKAKERYNIQ